MTTKRNEIAATILTVLTAVIGWTYLLAVVGSSLAYPTIV